METAKTHILSLSPSELKTQITDMGEKSFRAGQVVDWLYKKSTVNPEKMTNLSKQLREQIAITYDTALPTIKHRMDGKDGTTKLLLQSKQPIETVIMRYPGRTTVCVSSQVGCRLACSFCQTGKLGFFRNLSAAEILAQVYISNEILLEEDRRVTNVVFMGMGEPFDNYDAAVFAANRMIDEDGLNLSARHVTLSTSGIAPKIKLLAEQSKAALAVSLHAANDELRTKLMPINQRYNLATLKEALKYYQTTTGRKITIEYILIEGENTSLKDAKELVRYLQGLKAKVNLIPFNAHPGLAFDRPMEQTILAFQKHLADRSIPAPVRYSRGLEVSGACGQLAAKFEEELTMPPERKHVASMLNP